ncbi:MAG: heavy metal-binding domain-containing protein [Verrucomicrobia bacterium]|nr:heavy metal-binding domain-containing protein [Verrucomicrobiota bacterium]
MMADLISLLVGIAIFLALLGLGFFMGWNREQRHLRDLRRREQAMGDMGVTQLKSFPGSVAGPLPPAVFFGETAIATDYFKSFMAKLRNIFGGEVKSYQSLMERARRESLLRILEQARRHDYNAVGNVRYDCADVGGNSTLRKTAMVCILASATAYYVARRPR